MEEFPELWQCRVDKLFLDTTYCRPEYDFPPQSDVIKGTSDQIEAKCSSRINRLLVCVGSYTIGKERIFAAIADHFAMKIWAGGDKVRVLKAVNDTKIIKNMTSIQTDAQVGYIFVMVTILFICHWNSDIWVFKKYLTRAQYGAELRSWTFNFTTGT